jgi:hypothetical protein
VNRYWGWEPLVLYLVVPLLWLHELQLVLMINSKLQTETLLKEKPATNLLGGITYITQSEPNIGDGD